ncbi:MAG: hypothetical protein H6729_07900 [Deltaproteobacteria bacterium]|nr:hypothetical protein [Deltaproteobacteria bacterium]
MSIFFGLARRSGPHKTRYAHDAQAGLRSPDTAHLRPGSGEQINPLKKALAHLGPDATDADVMRTVLQISAEHAVDVSALRRAAGPGPVQDRINQVVDALLRSASATQKLGGATLAPMERTRVDVQPKSFVWVRGDTVHKGSMIVEGDRNVRAPYDFTEVRVAYANQRPYIELINARSLGAKLPVPRDLASMLQPGQVVPLETGRVGDWFDRAILGLPLTPHDRGRLAGEVVAVHHTPSSQSSSIAVRLRPEDQADWLQGREIKLRLE